MEPQYNIIFRGKIVSGKDPENARKVLNAIFKQQAPKVLGSMNGGAPYIRKNLTLDQARKFKAVFDKAGAQIQVVKTFKCPDCGHIQKTNSQCEKCMNLKMEFESGPEPDPIDETPAKAAASPKRPKGKGPAPTFSTKKLNQYATYKVVFKGKIQPGFDQETVKNHLANEFKAEVFKVNAPFAGGDDYHQGQLNGIKAEELRERFELAGALVEVIETVKCPMCGKVLDAGENCPDCFEEREPQAIEDAGAWDIAPEIAKPQRDNAAFGEGVDDKEELRLEGMVRFRRGVILFSVLFLLHSFIGRERAFAISWIYLLPVPYFLGACYNLAKHKGYSTKFGLLGILSLLGATVMLLLPNKSQGREHGRFFKKRHSCWLRSCSFPPDFSDLCRHRRS